MEKHKNIEGNDMQEEEHTKTNRRPQFFFPKKNESERKSRIFSKKCLKRDEEEINNRLSKQF